MGRSRTFVSLQRTVLLLGFLFTTSTHVRAAPITFDFESFADGVVVTKQLPGLRFAHASAITAGPSLNEFEFSPASGFSVVFDDGGPLEIEYLQPTFAISRKFTYSSQLTIEAFNGANILLGSVSSLSGNLALSGSLGSHPNELVTPQSVAPNSQVAITGDAAGASFVLDDLVLTPSDAPPQPVPEPGTFLSVGAGVSAAWLRRRRSVVKLLSFVSTIAASTAASAQTGAESIKAFPATIQAGRPTTVTVSAQVPTDARLLPQSVSLLRVNPDGTTRSYGRMYDDQTHGDALVGDQLFTTQIVLNELTAQQITLRASVAYRGILRRVISDPINVTVQATESAISTLNRVADLLVAGRVDEASGYFANKVELLAASPPFRLKLLADALRTATLSADNGGRKIYIVKLSGGAGAPSQSTVTVAQDGLGRWLIVGW